MNMDHYIDIHLLPDPEFPQPMLMSALFSKLHRGLVECGRGGIGVSFPEFNPAARVLGRTLRLHGGPDELELLMAAQWIQGMRDHTRVRSTTKVPNDVRYRTVRRVQAKSGAERLRRRLMNRKGIDHAAAMSAIPDSAEERLMLPYVTLTSASTRQNFRLFIEHAPLQGAAREGTFTHYGLSPTATIPWF